MDSGERHLPSTLRSAQWIQRSKPLLFVAGLLPLARWVHLGIQDGLGANPIEFLTRSSGTWALVCLLVTLSITPLWRLLGMPALLRWRRMCSLFAFFYASLHFLAWVGWDRGFSFPDMVSDVIQRPFIAVGLAAFVLMTVLVITSTHAAMRRADSMRKQFVRRIENFNRAGERQQKRMRPQIQKDRNRIAKKMEQYGFTVPDLDSLIDDPSAWDSVEASSGQATQATTTVEDLVQEAYLRTLSRYPDEEEVEISVGFIEESSTPADGVQSLLWALVNTKEFIITH